MFPWRSSARGTYGPTAGRAARARPANAIDQLVGVPHGGLPFAVGQDDGKAVVFVGKTDDPRMSQMAAGRLQETPSLLEPLHTAGQGKRCDVVQFH